MRYSIKIEIFPFLDFKASLTEIDQNLFLISRVNVPELAVKESYFLSSPSF
jgi:hypothetical protein